MCQVRGASAFDNSTLLIVGECIEDKHFICVFATGEYSAHVFLFHMCHSWSGVALWYDILGYHCTIGMSGNDSRGSI